MSYDPTDLLNNDFHISGNIFFKNMNILQKVFLSGSQIKNMAKIYCNQLVRENLDNPDFYWTDLINEYSLFLQRSSLSLHGRGIKSYVSLWNKNKIPLRSKLKKEEKLDYE